MESEYARAVILCQSLSLCSRSTQLQVQKATSAQVTASMEIWCGVDASGKQVDYYFNYSHSLAWAFEPDHGSKPTAQIAPAAPPPLPTVPAPAREPPRAGKSIPSEIWESEIYR